MPTNPLDELADIHLPDSVSWWPLAAGWWILIALLFIIAIAVYILQRKKKRNHYRQLALQELHHAYEHARTSPAIYLQNISGILRRTAMSAHPNTFNSSIKGEDWLNWLDAHCSATQKAFAQGAGQALLIGPYQKTPQVDIDALHQLCVQWVTQHRNQFQKIKKTPAQKKEATDV